MNFCVLYEFQLCCAVILYCTILHFDIVLLRETDYPRGVWRFRLYETHALHGLHVKILAERQPVRGSFVFVSFPEACV